MYVAICIACRGQPPDYLLKEAKNTGKFFKCIGSVHSVENGEVSLGYRSSYKALTVEEYEIVSEFMTCWLQMTSYSFFRAYRQREMCLLSSFLWHIALH